MRSKFAYIAILALTFALLIPSTAAAAEKQVSVDVGAARVAAENLLLSRGINPSDAVFQVGPRNYAGANCPGSGWNCTAASIVVQISTSGAVNAGNKADECTEDPCLIEQHSAGGRNDASCVKQSSANPASQACIITQTNTTGANRAFVRQSIEQSRPDGSQDARQTATVSQSNGAGTNNSAISQTIQQRQASDLTGSSLTQGQESHQRADVCQGGAGNPCADASGGKNVSVVSQSNAQRLTARFSAGSNGPIDQNQNTLGGPTSLAIVRQNSTTGSGDSRLDQSSREIASAGAGTADGDESDESKDQRVTDPSPFAGTVTVRQQQGVTGNPTCPESGVCGFDIQKSTGVLSARERQDELQKLQGPVGAVQFQYGPEFCCATQIGGNPNNRNDVDQNKVQLHTSSRTEGWIQGHCESSPGGCRVNETLTDNSTTKTNSCAGTSCNITVHCSTPSEGSPCGKTSGEGSPPPPCPPDTECSVGLLSRAEGAVAVRADALLWRADGFATG